MSFQTPKTSVYRGRAFTTVHDASTWWRKRWSRSSVMTLNTRRDDVEHKACVQRHHAGSGSALAPPRACVMYCRECMSTRETVEMKMWNKIFIFVFFVQKLFSWLRKITVEPLMLHGLFYQSPCYVSGHGNISVVLLSMEGLRALRFKQKYLNLCSDDERRSYGFGMTSGYQ